jgi:hypothetical protein
VTFTNKPRPALSYVRTALGRYAPYAKLKARQQREGQPTMPKFVDPGDPPSFQETMWKKGYKCQEDDWLSYVED